MRGNELLSYIYDFISQIIDNKDIFDSVRSIILFGSIVRGDFKKDSDIDIFIDVKSKEEKHNIDNIIKKELGKFELRGENSWHLRGIKLPINLIIDDINNEEWKDLKEEIKSYGKILYGKYSEAPEKLEHKIIISYDIIQLAQKKKMFFLRKLYRYTTKKKNKLYKQSGLLNEINGERIGTNSMIISTDHLTEIRKFLKDNKAKYAIIDIWTKQS